MTALRHEPPSVWEQRDARFKAIAAGMGVPSRFEHAVAVVVERRRVRAELAALIERLRPYYVPSDVQTADFGGGCLDDVGVRL